MSDTIVQFVALPSPITVRYRNREGPEKDRGSVVQVTIIGMGMMNKIWRPCFLDGAFQLTPIPKGVDVEGSMWEPISARTSPLVPKDRSTPSVPSGLGRARTCGQCRKKFEGHGCPTCT